jgi:hypothetical protein
MAELPILGRVPHPRERDRGDARPVPAPLGQGRSSINLVDLQSFVVYYDRDHDGWLNGKALDELQLDIATFAPAAAPANLPDCAGSSSIIQGIVVDARGHVIY